MKLFIDADGCPVTDIAIKLAKQNNIECIIVCDSAHSFDKDGVTVVTVTCGADSADFALVNMVGFGDIVITQDYGLAAMCLARNCVVINQNGLIFNNDNIDALLMQRHIAKKVRRSGGRLKGPSKREKSMDECFETVLSQLIAADKTV